MVDSADDDDTCRILDWDKFDYQSMMHDVPPMLSSYVTVQFTTLM